MANQDMDDIFKEGTPVELAEPAPQAKAEPVAEAPAQPATGELATPPVAEKKVELVPLAAHLDERERRQKYEREAAELREKLEAIEAAKQAPPPDLYADPEARLQFERSTYEQMVVNAKLDQSRWLAERDFGKALVDEAFEFYNQHPILSHQFKNEPSPFHSAVEFYKRQKAAETVGPDLDAYKARLRAEWEAEQQAKAAESAPSQTQAARLPGSLAAAPAAGKTSEPSGLSGFDAAFGR